MAEALAAKNSEIETLVSSMETHKKQAALSEGNLASLQVSYAYLLPHLLVFMERKYHLSSTHWVLNS